MLTEGAVRDAEPREKTYKMSDTGGLFVMVNPDGSRWWRLRYKYGEKERGISLGKYPLVSLKLARQRRDDAKRMLQDGLDPSHQRRVQRVSQTVTFELVAQEWLELQSKKLGPVTIAKARWILEKHVYPQLGAGPSSQIKAPDLFVGGGRNLHRYGGRKLHTQAGWQLRERSWSCPCTVGSDECCYVTIWSKG